METKEQTQAELKKVLDERTILAMARHDYVMNDVVALIRLQKENALKFKTSRNNGFFEFPCDICGKAAQTADVVHLVIDKAEDDSLADRFLSGFICDSCAKKFAPEELLAKVDREKAEIYAKMC